MIYHCTFSFIITYTQNVARERHCIRSPYPSGNANAPGLTRHLDLLKHHSDADVDNLETALALLRQRYHPKQFLELLSADLKNGEEDSDKLTRERRAWRIEQDETEKKKKEEKEKKKKKEASIAKRREQKHLQRERERKETLANDKARIEKMKKEDEKCRLERKKPKSGKDYLYYHVLRSNCHTRPISVICVSSTTDRPRCTASLHQLLSEEAG